jgi:hypothetical protein
MNEIERYQVFEDQSWLDTEKKTKKIESDCLNSIEKQNNIYKEQAFLISSGVILAMMFIICGIKGDGLCAIISMALSVTMFVIYNSNDEKRKNEIKKHKSLKDKEINKAIAEKNNKISQVNNQAYSYLKKNDDLVKSINNDIKYIFSELDVAKIDFSERAFSPFWNRIKNSLIALDNIDKTIKKQSILEKEYRYLLNGKPHNFPPLEFNINYEKIDIASKEVKRLTRSAEKDFQFAMIFEKKKIQDICVFGFRNMTESIYNIERSVRNGF